MQKPQEQVQSLLSENIDKAFENYGLIIAVLVIGIILGWSFKAYILNRKYEKQIKIRLDEKDQRIAELNFIVHDRLNKIKVDKLDRSYFKRVKKFFKKFAIKEQ